MVLAFAAHVEVLAIEGRGLVALGEQTCELYSGAIFATLAALIDGSRAEGAILAACENGDRGAAAGAIGELRRAGVVVELRDGDFADASAAWWSSQLVSPEAAAARTRDAAISVQALGDLDTAPTIQALTDAGLRLADPAELAVVLVDDYLDDGLAKLNARALRDVRGWMLAQPRGAQILIGPVFSPHRGPCWECLAARLRRRRALEHRLRAAAGSVDGRRVRVSGPPSQRGLGPALIATEALRWIAGSRPELETTILSFDARSWTSARHSVVWRPQCHACGEWDASVRRHAAPIHTRRARSRARSGGDLRDVAPKLTLERFEHHVSPITGVVHELARLPGEEHLHAYVAPNRRVHVNRDWHEWEPLTGRTASGKGTSDDLARASALCEALEVYSGCFFGVEPRHDGTFEDLGDDAVHPNACMRFSERQFDERDRWNEQARSSRTYVPERFDPCDRIGWSPVWSLTHQRERLVPTALCYFGADVPGARYCVATSNGNAAGNTIEEAVLHGLLELIERDHVALWWYNRTRAPTLDLDTIDDPWLSQLREHLSARHFELWALDLTADLRIPVCACLATSPGGSSIGMGFGAHPDRRGAVIRAATELAQLGLGGASGGGLSGVHPRLDLDDHPFARPDPESSPLSCADDASISGDVVEALDGCRQAIERRGMELLVLDQTRPDIGLPVVKVLVPGMRHFWPRFGPGRLYEVPVSLGRLERSHQEHELNPVPLVT